MDFNDPFQYISNMPKNQLCYKKKPAVSIFCGLLGILTGMPGTGNRTLPESVSERLFMLFIIEPFVEIPFPVSARYLTKRMDHIFLIHVTELILPAVFLKRLKKGRPSHLPLNIMKHHRPFAIYQQVIKRPIGKLIGRAVNGLIHLR